MMETISYYNANGSNVYALMLDASKAFDMVNYCKLFIVLLKRKVSPLILRLVLYMYTKQKLQVRWGSSMPSQFTACNGVKQGAIISPILFSIYMDGLFEQLEKSGVGCHMGNHYTGCIGYADDLTLLTPTQSGLKVLTDICKKYAHEYRIHFYGTKSRYLIFRGRNCKPDNITVFLMTPSCIVPKMLYIWVIMYPLLIRIVQLPMPLTHFGEGIICSWPISLILRQKKKQFI